MSTEPWYSIAENDVFPETFGSFFFPQADARQLFYRNHRELVTAEFWNHTRQTIIDGGQQDVFPYPAKRRFSCM
jgi:isocitrate dehydrogenase kinase/phosphatase